MGLTTLTELKEVTKITSVTYDTLLTNLSNRVNYFINTLVNYKLEKTLFEEVYNGPGDYELLLDNAPIISIDVLSIDIDISAKTYGGTIYTTDDLMINKTIGIIEIPGYKFTESRSSIFVKYYAGYEDADMPLDLKQVALELAAKKFQDIEDSRIGVTSKNIMNDSINFTLAMLPDAHKNIIDRWRKLPGIEGKTVIGYTAE